MRMHLLRTSILLALLAAPVIPAAAQRPNIDYVTSSCNCVGAPASFALVHVTDGGRYLILEDGTRWEVSPDDQGTAANWAEDASIVIRAIPAPTEKWEWSLINADLDQRAAARFAGRPIVTGEDQEEQPGS
jgi:hypothetical protein